MKPEGEKNVQNQAPDEYVRTYYLKLRKDAHGQPVKQFKTNFENNVSKAIDQLSGICAGVLADGVVNDKEAVFFRDWVREHAAFEPVWPFTDILKRIEKVFDHGPLGEDERKELADIMRAICGKTETKEDLIHNHSSKLPLDEPPPTIEFKGNEFVVTGRFAFGTRKKVNESIESLGGISKDSFPTLSTRYLVIGAFASRDWYNTNYGRKIERAVELRSSAAQIAIISEEWWRSFIV